MQPYKSVTKTLAVVTGASRSEGIGYEVCRQLARRGMHVILTARQADQAAARASELAADHLEVEAMPLDIGNPQSIRSLTAQLSTRFSSLDILVNNAAAMAPYGELAATADLEVAPRHRYDSSALGIFAKPCCLYCARAAIRASSTFRAAPVRMATPSSASLPTTAWEPATLSPRPLSMP